MEAKSDFKKCDFCKSKPTCLCYKCMCYFCDSCFKLAHNNEDNNNHIKENVDYYIPIDLKCQAHKTHPMDLFCVDEKGNKINI